MKSEKVFTWRRKHGTFTQETGVKKSTLTHFNSHYYLSEFNLNHYLFLNLIKWFLYLNPTEMQPWVT